MQSINIRALILGLCFGTCLGAVTACGAPEDVEQTEPDYTEDGALGEVSSDYGQAEQEITAACGDTQPNYGVDLCANGWNFARCNRSLSSHCCHLPATDVGFEMALHSGPWTAADRAEWAPAAAVVQAEFRSRFSYWNRFNNDSLGPESFVFSSGVFNSDLAQYAQNAEDVVELRKAALPQPSWWAARATTSSAPIGDLVQQVCMLSSAVTESHPATFRSCRWWVANIDYDRVRQWAIARSVSVQFLIRNIWRKVGARAVGLGSGANTYMTDSTLYASNNEADMNCSGAGCELAWVNNYRWELGAQPLVCTTE